MKTGPQTPFSMSGALLINLEFQVVVLRFWLYVLRFWLYVLRFLVSLQNSQWVEGRRFYPRPVLIPLHLSFIFLKNSPVFI